MSSKTIGIVGGGQLGMMLIDAIHSLGGKAIVLDPTTNCPASYNADEFICARYDDLDALDLLGSKSDVITYEFENIKASDLNHLNDKYNIKQGIKQLFDSQDRLIEKNNASSHGLPTCKYIAVNNKEELKGAINIIGYPSILKTRTMGYDGHGQVVIRCEDDLINAYELLNVSCILEEMIQFDYETSCILISNKNDIVTLPLGHNIHKEGILDLTVVPSNINEALSNRIEEASKSFVRKCGYEGILCIEYFVKGDNFYFNEMAPRPHNSGHYSIEGLSNSQYDLFARYLLDLPLVNPTIKTKTIMKNILGNDMWLVPSFYDDIRAHIHMYNKKESRPKRKMGHITFTDMDLNTYNEIIKNL